MSLYRGVWAAGRDEEMRTLPEPDLTCAQTWHLSTGHSPSPPSHILSILDTHTHAHLLSVLECMLSTLLFGRYRPWCVLLPHVCVLCCVRPLVLYHFKKKVNVLFWMTWLLWWSCVSCCGGFLGFLCWLFSHVSCYLISLCVFSVCCCSCKVCVKCVWENAVVMFCF